jgi:hypothetical protein
MKAGFLSSATKDTQLARFNKLKALWLQPLCDMFSDGYRALDRKMRHLDSEPPDEVFLETLGGFVTYEKFLKVLDTPA